MRCGRVGEGRQRLGQEQAGAVPEPGRQELPDQPAPLHSGLGAEGSGAVAVGGEGAALPFGDV